LTNIYILIEMHPISHTMYYPQGCQQVHPSLTIVYWLFDNLGI
jgi:hypothetical protein